MTINDQTLRQNVWSTIKDIIVDLGPYVTNTSTGATSLASVKGVYNDESTNRPIVVINPIQVTNVGKKFNDNTPGKRQINVVVDCYYNNTLGSAQLMDAVDYALTNTDIAEIEFISSTPNSDFEPVNGTNKVFASSTTYLYNKE